MTAQVVPSPNGWKVTCGRHGQIGTASTEGAHQVSVAKAHNNQEHWAEVREKLISESGQPSLRSVYRSVCDDCHIIEDDWATPSSAARQARQHNGTVHAYWGDVRMKINERKDNPMRDSKTVDTAIELAEARLAALLEEREQLRKLPAEPEQDDTVITFKVRFDEHSRTRYSYAAIRARGVWFLTGTVTRGKPWSEILEIAGQDIDVRAGRRRLSFEVFPAGTGARLKAAR